MTSARLLSSSSSSLSLFHSFFFFPGGGGGGAKKIFLYMCENIFSTLSLCNFFEKFNHIVNIFV